MKILVIGQGGREHALAWKLSQSKKSKLFSLLRGMAVQALKKNALMSALM